MSNILEIIIPAYNCSKTLNRALDSLVYQINKNFKVLIIDDCSTEDIKSIINTYFDKLNITYIKNEKNIGCGMTRQVGIDNTKANYISFLDADDVLLPNAVSDWLSEIDKNAPEVIYTPFINMKNNILLKSYSTLFMTHGKVYNVDFLRKYDIRESEQIKCNDDSYFNYQVFDLATNISILKNITHIYISTDGSITNSSGFLKQAFLENNLVTILVRQQISRFKDNPLQQYNRIQRQVNQMLFEEREYFTQQMEEIKKDSWGPKLNN